MRHARITSLALAVAGFTWAACRDAAGPGQLHRSAQSPLTSTPIAAFNVSCAALTCQFTDLSVDSGGVITSWHWTFGDGTFDTIQNPAHTYGAPGSYVVELGVRDTAGLTDTATRVVMVGTGVNQPPFAFFDFNCVLLTCQFTDLSSDSDGVIVQRLWFFGDGTSDTLPNPIHTYGAAGTYNVTLVVTDNGGAEDTAFRAVTVSDTGGGGGGDTLTLTATGLRARGVLEAALSWHGVSADSFAVFRDSALIALVHDTTYLDVTGMRGQGSFTYQVCVLGRVCSNTATVRFGGKRR